MKQPKTILELADDYAKAYFKGSDPSESASMGRGEDARKLLQAAIIQNEVEIEKQITKVLDKIIWRKELLKVRKELQQYRIYTDKLEARIEELEYETQ